MKKLTLLALGLLLTFADTFAEGEYREVSGVYVGGHIRRERPGTITKLRNSGFTYVILFNVHVEADGTLKTDGETICENGEYVFYRTQPYYQQDVANLKTAPTSITRIEICVGGAGDGSYNNIKSFINSKGTGSNTMLYKNFKALKEAVPEIEAVNNDIESGWDVSTSAKFHIMMANIGYKTTYCPYNLKDYYWVPLHNQIRASKPKAVDRVMVQCYDGGAGNVSSNVLGTWNFTGVTERHAGLMYYSNDWSVDKNMAQFQKWKDDGVATGGFVWVYNSEEWNLNAWAAGINRIYGAITVPEDEVAVKCYSEKNYKGYCVSLPPGEYCQSDLAVYGLAAKDLSSLEIVDDMYQVILYKTTDHSSNTKLTRKASTRALSASWDNQVCSLIIEINPTGIKDLKDDRQQTTDNRIYNLSGQRLDKMQKGINILNGKKIMVK